MHLQYLTMSRQKEQILITILFVLVSCCITLSAHAWPTRNNEWEGQRWSDPISQNEEGANSISLRNRLEILDMLKELDRQAKVAAKRDNPRVPEPKLWVSKKGSGGERHIPCFWNVVTCYK
ncbi:uncharacterized protein LOC101850568 [Aplysia californica]|uniref:Uncharacterized protein LOC101850568 n=1 Tax=Aplysia californica TaxID=6500 RepID=A0ABM0JR81_APLCA|nr:uncharacterized protein LOC101850568 [Aplysia californica]